VVHSGSWALAYGERASQFANALKVATTLATARYCYGDDFTVENYEACAGLSPGQDNAAFAEAVNRLPDDTIYCVPVAHIEQANVTTVGLGDTFVGGFLSALAARA
jgi:ADP-dependent phosphofructokinase/glucokinase